jgi:hypothetical protein
MGLLGPDSDPANQLQINITLDMLYRQGEQTEKK